MMDSVLSIRTSWLLEDAKPEGESNSTMPSQREAKGCEELAWHMHGRAETNKENNLKILKRIFTPLHPRHIIYTVEDSERES